MEHRGYIVASKNAQKQNEQSRHFCSSSREDGLGCDFGVFGFLWGFLRAFLGCGRRG